MMKKKTVSSVAFILAAACLLMLSACGTSTAPAVSPVETTAASAVDTIMTVGTTQAFSDEAVAAEDVQTILQAGLAAESAINQQPWFFVAGTDKEVIAELSASGGMPGGVGMPSMPKDGEAPAIPNGGEMPAAPKDGSMPAPPQGGAPGAGGGSAKAALGNSPLAIIVYKNDATSSPNPDFDCGLAVQNMYIAAASLGYGAKIISSPTMTLNGANHDQICEKLGVDPSLTAVAVLLITII